MIRAADVQLPRPHSNTKSRQWCLGRTRAEQLGALRGAPTRCGHGDTATKHEDHRGTDEAGVVGSGIRQCRVRDGGRLAITGRRRTASRGGGRTASRGGGRTVRRRAVGYRRLGLPGVELQNERSTLGVGEEGTDLCTAWNCVDADADRVLTGLEAFVVPGCPDVFANEHLVSAGSSAHRGADQRRSSHRQWCDEDKPSKSPGISPSCGAVEVGHGDPPGCSVGAFTSPTTAVWRGTAT